MSRRQTAGLTCGGPTSRYFQVLPLQQVDLTALCRHMSGHIPTPPTEEKEGLVFYVVFMAPYGAWQETEFQTEVRFVGQTIRLTHLPLLVRPTITKYQLETGGLPQTITTIQSILTKPSKQDSTTLHF